MEQPDDIAQIKRGSVMTIDNIVLPAPPEDDHGCILGYRIDAAGVETLVFKSDPFYYGPVEITFTDLNDAAAFEMAVVDDTFYKLVVTFYDAAETSSAYDSEHYVHCFPDELETAAGSVDSLDSTLFSKLLWMLGHNVLDGEFDQPSGYTEQRTRRGYVSMSESEALALLAVSNSPGDTGVMFKSLAALITDDVGNESVALETEQDVT